MRSKVLKPLEEEIKSLEGEIVSCEARIAAVNEEMADAVAKDGTAAMRKSEFWKELKELSEKIDSCYSRLDEAMKEHDVEKRKYSDC